MSDKKLAKEIEETIARVWATLDEMAKSSKEFKREREEAERRAEEKRQRIEKELKEERRKTEEERRKIEKELKEERRKTEEERRKTEEERQRIDLELKEERRKTEEERRRIDLELKDAQRETQKTINRVVGEWGNEWGKFVESLVEGNLIGLLQARGMKVHEMGIRRKGEDKNGDRWEYDLVIVNGGEVVVVEVKSHLKVKHVVKFVEKDLSRVKERMSVYANHKLYGGVAYLKCDDGADVFAEKQKLFVIKATGDSARILNKKGFEPRRF